MKRPLVVSLPGAPVGSIEQGRGGMTSWHPNPAWEEVGQHPRLGLDFLRTRGPRLASAEIPSWFENLLPERESALRARLCANHDLRDGQSFDLLRLLGGELPGAVVVNREVTSSSPDESNPDETGAEQDVEDAGDPPIRMSSLAGMQLKFSMSMVNERLTLPATRGGEEWIVKLAGIEYDELAAVEAATMTWAKRAGFDVPRHFTVPFDELVGVPAGWADTQLPAFAIRRFDRRADGSRLHHEDLCQALGLRPRDKYGDGNPSVRFEGAVRLMTDACDVVGGREMVSRIGFMIASGNTDAHLKNWGLVWAEKVRPTIAPCYDLVATIAWGKLGWERNGGPRLALHLGKRHRFADLDDAAIDAFAGGVQHSWAKEALMEGLERARDSYRETDVPVPQRMASALEAHWKRVPILRRMGSLVPPGS